MRDYPKTKNRFLIGKRVKMSQIFFAKIVDYKSSFTSRYSIEVAEKAAFFCSIYRI